MRTVFVYLFVTTITIVATFENKIIIQKLNQNVCLLNQQYCKCPIEDRISCVGFNSYDELDFNLNVDDDFLEFEFFELSPARSVVFNQDLDLNGLRLSDKSTVKLNNIRSFQFEWNPFIDTLVNSRIDKLEIYSSLIQFNYFL